LDHFALNRINERISHVRQSHGTCRLALLLHGNHLQSPLNVVDVSWQPSDVSTRRRRSSSMVKE
jgi:hypothetical protein